MRLKGRKSNIIKMFIFLKKCFKKVKKVIFLIVVPADVKHVTLYLCMYTYILYIVQLRIIHNT